MICYSRNFVVLKKKVFHLTNAKLHNLFFMSLHHLISPLFSFEIMDGTTFLVFLTVNKMMRCLMVSCLWILHFHPPPCVIRSLMLK